MKLIILVALALAAVAVAAPPELFRILKSEYNVNPEGSYNFDFETENKIVRSELGEIKDVLDEDNKPRPVLITRGFYSYIDSEGKPVRIDYTADEAGFHPVGDSIPTVIPSRR